MPETSPASSRAGGLAGLKHQIGDIVYLHVAPTDPGMVTGLIVRVSVVCYLVTWASATETSHYDIELTDERGI